jgi:hypothetical protein
MAFVDLLNAFPVGNGAGHFDDPVVGPHGQAELFDRPLQQGAADRVQRDEATDLFAGKCLIGLSLSQHLPVSREHHPFTYLCAVLFNGALGGRSELNRLARHLHMQIDPIQQRTGDAAAVAADLRQGALTAVTAIPQMSARGSSRRSNSYWDFLMFREFH